MKNCLVQAVAAEVMLNQAGHPRELRIGVANGADELIAHAWVESEGRVVIGEIELDRYAPLKRLHVQSGKSPLQLGGVHKHPPKRYHADYSRRNSQIPVSTETRPIRLLRAMRPTFSSRS